VGIVEICRNEGEKRIYSQKAKNESGMKNILDGRKESEKVSYVQSQLH
jgi:hypothetical protein